MIFNFDFPSITVKELFKEYTTKHGVPIPILRLVITLVGILAFIGVYLLLSGKKIQSILSHRCLTPILLFSITIIINLAWLALFGDVKQVSDFGFLMDLSTRISQVGQVPVNLRWYLSFAPYFLGYASFLAFLLSVFGKSLLVAHLTNVLFSGVIAVLLFLVGNKLSGSPRIGILAAFMWLVMPSMIAISTFVQTEMLFIVLMLAAIYVCMQLPFRGSLCQDGVLFLLACAFLILMNEVRPLGPLVLAAFAMFLLIISGLSRRKMLRRVFLFGTVLTVYLLAAMVTDRAKSKFLGMDIAQNSYGYGLSLGMNYETNGSWNEQDAASGSAAEKNGLTAQQFHQEMLLQFQQRVFDLFERGQLIPFLATKAASFWTNPNAYLDWTLVSLENGSNKEKLLQAFYQGSSGLYGAILIFSLVGVLLTRQEKNYSQQAQSFFLRVILFAWFAFFLVYEKNPRYLVPAIPLLMLLSAVGVQQLVFLPVIGQTKLMMRISNQSTSSAEKTAQ